MLSTQVLGPRLTASLRSLYRACRGFDPCTVGPSQSNEADIIERLIQHAEVPPSFCEFGFSLSEFNCGRLVLKGWRGLLIDGDARYVSQARDVLRRAPHLPVSVEHAFLDRTNLRPLITGHLPEIGVLSIDVDGNDYWFLSDLIDLRPALVVSEYNASFGLRCLTVPYDARFDRTQKHPSGWYHGASITALAALCARHGYRLVAVSDSGINAFFIRNDVAGDLPPLDPAVAYREHQLRNNRSGTTAAQQWAQIRHLPLVEVPGATER